MTIAERDEEAPVRLRKGDVIDVDVIDERLDDADDLPDDDDESSALERYADAWTPSAARGTVEHWLERPLPTVRQMWQSTRWWGGTAARVAPHLLVRLLPALLAQVRPTIVGLGRVLQMWAVWRCGTDYLVDVKQAEGNERAKARDKWERRRHARNVMSVIGWAALAIGLLVGMSLWPGYTWLAILGLLVLLDALGHRGASSVALGGALPHSALRVGAPLRVIVPQVADTLAGRGHTVTIVNPTVGRYGIAMDVHSPTELDDKDLEALERGLQSFPGAISQIRSRENAAVTELRIMWEDPLAEMHSPPLWTPLSQTVNDAGTLGYGLGALPLHLNFLRTNILVCGGPGSGKSSAFWCMIDYLTACRDVVIDGIDLSGGPALDAWGDCIRHFATSEGEAEEILRDALDLANRRTRRIAGRSRPRRGGGPVGSENWGTADGNIHIILIDELPLVAGHNGKGGTKNLLGMYSEHQRVGRKAASTSIAATQDLAGDTLGATSLRKYPSTTVLLACSREDVTLALGGGKVKEGWSPHRFTPAEGDDPNDAGKCFIHSGRHRVPNPWRFNRLDEMSAIHSRALDRIDAGRPVLADDDTFGVVDSVVLPDELAMVHAAFDAARWPEFLATADILAAIAAARGNAPTEAKLAELVRPHGLRPDPKRRRTNGSNPRYGYTSDALRAAIADLDRAAPEGDA